MWQVRMCTCVDVGRCVHPSVSVHECVYAHVSVYGCVCTRMRPCTETGGSLCLSEASDRYTCSFYEDQGLQRGCIFVVYWPHYFTFRAWWPRQGPCGCVYKNVYKETEWAGFASKLQNDFHVVAASQAFYPCFGVRGVCSWQRPGLSPDLPGAPAGVWRSWIHPLLAAPSPH